MQTPGGPDGGDEEAGTGAGAGADAEPGAGAGAEEDGCALGEGCAPEVVASGVGLAASCDGTPAVLGAEPPGERTAAEEAPGAAAVPPDGPPGRPGPDPGSGTPLSRMAGGVPWATGGPDGPGFSRIVTETKTA